MATILLTWELGAGIGHLMNLRPIGVELMRRGHRVVAAVQDLTAVGEIFRSTGIAFLQAPVIPRRGSPRFEPTHSYAQILGNIGFSDEAMLATLMTAWNTILDMVRPDLVVADHSPTVLLALRGRPIRRVNIGLGFFCPPDVQPLPIWLAPGDPQRQQVTRDEAIITDTVNHVLEKARQPKLARLGEIFGQVDEVFLATYPEFDHFGPRLQLRYWGHWPFSSAVETPQWPEGSGPKIYAYLKSYSGLEALLKALEDQQVPTLIFSGGIGPAVQMRFAGPLLRFTPKPVDLRQVAQVCDLAVVQAGHGTAAALLLAGKPCVLVPLYLEQLLFARKAAQTGAARVLGKDASAPAAEVLQEMLAQESYRRNARALAERYATFIPGGQIGELVDHLEAVCRRRW